MARETHGLEGLATNFVVQRDMKPTDETPNLAPDENNDEATAPLAGVQTGSDDVAEGIDTEPESLETGPNVPGQPPKPDEIGGI